MEPWQFVCKQIAIVIKLNICHRIGNFLWIESCLKKGQRVFFLNLNIFQCGESVFREGIPFTNFKHFLRTIISLGIPYAEKFLRWDSQQGKKSAEWFPALKKSA